MPDEHDNSRREGVLCEVVLSQQPGSLENDFVSLCKSILTHKLRRKKGGREGGVMQQGLHNKQGKKEGLVTCQAASSKGCNSSGILDYTLQRRR